MLKLMHLKKNIIESKRNYKKIMINYSKIDDIFKLIILASTAAVFMWLALCHYVGDKVVKLDKILIKPQNLR